MTDKAKQTRIENYFKIKDIKVSTTGPKEYEKHKQTKQNYRENAENKSKMAVYGSRIDEGSGTEVMESEEQQRACSQQILITAMDTIYSDSIMEKIQKVLNNYSKENVIEMIRKNGQFHRVRNVQNLKRINDQDFWTKTMPNILIIVRDNSYQVSSSIQMLPEGCNKQVSINKFDIFILLAQMFLCIMPKQTTTSLTTFGNLMQGQEVTVENSKAEVRYEKLKCIINYFNMTLDQTDLKSQTVQFYRTRNQSKGYLNGQSKINLTIAAIQDNLLIEDYYGEGIMIDFAHQSIGGGVLNNGSLQEEIMFITFPQLIISRLICEKMEDQEAIIIYGADKYSQYTGYSSSFKYLKPYLKRPQKKSVIVAIDATNYSKYPDNDIQYSKKHYRRQIHKALTGFQGASLNASQESSICTGKWGCGAFKGNPLLKFLIQWIACSEAGRAMIFACDDKQLNKELRILVSQFSSKTTSDLFGILDQYWKIRKQLKSINLLDYIKDFV